MTDARPTPEDQVLKHYREHTTSEPPAHLDAFLLAAAQREVPVQKPGLWKRWVQACQKPRWQVAFASLVGVALMLALVQRTEEQPPSYDFAPAPKASAPATKKEASSSAARSMAAPTGALSAPPLRHQWPILLPQRRANRSALKWLTKRRSANARR